MSLHSFSMAKFLFIIIIPLLFSCTNTKFQKRQYCSVCLQTEDLVLLDIQVPDLSFGEEERIFNIIAKQLGKNKSVAFGRLEDWHYGITALNLKQGEISDLHDVLGITYILKVGLVGYNASDGLLFLEADKAQGLYPYPRTSITSSSKVEMSLWETRSGSEVFILDLVTKSSEYSKSDSDGSKYIFDTGTVYGTIKNGARRGSKYLLADCSCPKGSYVRWSRLLQWL